MREIKSKEDIKNLKIGDYLLWDNRGTHREAFFGEYTVVRLVAKESIPGTPIEDYCGTFKFPDYEVPQQLSFHNIKTHCRILDPDEDPEWLI